MLRKREAGTAAGPEKMKKKPKYIETLEWDTAFFDIKIARAINSRLNLNTIRILLDECKEEEIQCLYFDADIHDPMTISFAEQNGFRLVDVRILSNRLLDDPISPVKTIAEIGSFQEGDLPELRRIARTIHRVSRYYYDPRFRRYAKRLYRVWIENSRNGYADHIVVARYRDQPVGFITCKLDGSVGKMVLVSTDPAQKGKNIGLGMVMESCRWFKEQGARSAEVLTQGRNIPALRLYQKAGFRTSKVSLFYHRWSD